MKELNFKLNSAKVCVRPVLVLSFNNFHKFEHPKWLPSAVIENSENRETEYLMQYQVDFDQVCGKLRLSFSS